MTLRALKLLAAQSCADLEINEVEIVAMAKQGSRFVANESTRAIAEYAAFESRAAAYQAIAVDIGSGQEPILSPHP